MLLRELFSPERIIDNIEAVNKEELFRELAGIIAEKYNLKNPGAILEAIELRERKISTGIKEGIAIPHGKTDIVNRVCGIIGISHRGIDYNALDGKPVYLVFLIVSSGNHSEEHLEILKRLAILLEKSQFYDDILRTKEPEEIYKILTEYEKTIIG